MTSLPRFYCPVALCANTEITLPEAAAHHASRVLRLGVGAGITLFNGEGGEFAATLIATGKTVRAAITAKHAVERESPLDITLVQALTSHEKMDWIVQKAVELGVTRIQPFVATRSVPRPQGERAEKKTAHWQAVAIGACEQCGRNRVPEVLAPGSLEAALRQAGNALKLALSPDAGAPLAGAPRPTQPILLYVGPEGGFSIDEVSLLRAAHCQLSTLGPRILRTETAGIAALAALQTLWGDLK